MIRSALLVHGMGRSRLSMLRLAHALRVAGIESYQFGYFTAWESVDRIAGRLSLRIAELATGDYVLIGHSLGGVLLRLAVASLPPDVRRPARLIMIGTPNRSPLLARRFEHAWWYRIRNGEVGRFLASEARMARLPDPGIPCTVIAGTRGIHQSWSPFGAEENDGLVSVSETEFPAAEEWIKVDARHVSMMNHRETRRLIVERCTLR